jgi:hypothetical protein
MTHHAIRGMGQWGRIQNISDGGQPSGGCENHPPSGLAHCGDKRCEAFSRLTTFYQILTALSIGQMRSNVYNTLTIVQYVFLLTKAWH